MSETLDTCQNSLNLLHLSEILDVPAGWCEAIYWKNHATLHLTVEATSSPWLRFVVGNLSSSLDTSTTRMRSCRMHTTCSLPYGVSLSRGISVTETPRHRPPEQIPPRHIDPLGQRLLGQRHPLWTETTWTETPSGQRPPGQRPLDRYPLDRDPLDRNPLDRCSWDKINSTYLSCLL